MTTMTKMDNAEAAKILRDYNEYRRSGSALMNTAAEIGLAIDTAITALEPKVAADIDSICEAVTRATRVTKHEMQMRGRQREYVDARAIVSWLTFHYTKMTKSSIGRWLNRDHSCVHHYIGMVDSWLEDSKRNVNGVMVIQQIMSELDG